MSMYSAQRRDLRSARLKLLTRYELDSNRSLSGPFAHIVRVDWSEVPLDNPTMQSRP
jgi:hypothetical protein